MLLMIDNYDSFTYNLVQYFGELGEEVRVYRNDEIALDEIARLKPARSSPAKSRSWACAWGIRASARRSAAGSCMRSC